MAGDMLPQVLEEIHSLPFEARAAVEGEVKQLDPVALDWMPFDWKWRYSSNRGR